MPTNQGRSKAARYGRAERFLIRPGIDLPDAYVVHPTGKGGHHSYADSASGWNYVWPRGKNAPGGNEGARSYIEQLMKRPKER